MPAPVFTYLGATVPNDFGQILPPDDHWLASGPAEQILLPDLPVVDAHHHLWDHPGYRYLVPEFAADVNSGHNIVASVYVESHAMYRPDGPEQLKAVGETEFAVGQAEQSAAGQYGPAEIAAGIIGYADLTLGAAVRDVLEAHVAAGNGRFKGMRLPSAWDPDDRIKGGQAGDRPGVLLEPVVREGLGVLAEMSLVLECYVLFTQLGEVAAVADALPDLTIVVNHCCSPLAYGPYTADRAEHYDTWLTATRDAANRPNVVCKLGGLLNRTDAFDYIHADAPPSSEQLAGHWRQWVEPCIEAFGAERCMFESNYPVEKMGAGYATLWNTFKRLAAGASPEQRSALFSGTAARTYTLDI